jgi:TRAP-type C4-dicarboxylate transport system permease small subunit
VTSPSGRAEDLSSTRPEESDPEELPPITSWLSRLLAVASGCLLAGVFVTVLLQVVMRYFFNDPLTWTDEVTRLQMVWLTFVGAVLAYRLGKDIGVDALEDFANKRGLTWLARSAAGTIQLVVLLVALCFTLAGWQLTLQTMDRDTPALGIPVATFYAAVPAAGVLLLISIAERAVTRSARGR